MEGVAAQIAVLRLNLPRTLALTQRFLAAHVVTATGMVRHDPLDSRCRAVRRLDRGSVAPHGAGMCGNHRRSSEDGSAYCVGTYDLRPVLAATRGNAWFRDDGSGGFGGWFRESCLGDIPDATAPSTLRRVAGQSTTRRLTVSR